MSNFAQDWYSSISWLHSVPTHWKVLAGKRFHRRVKELNHQRSCSNVLSLTLNGVVNNDLSNPIGLVPQDYATYQLFKKGDLVFKLIDLENRSTSRVGLVHEEGIMSSVYIRVVPGPDSLPEFAHYYYYALYLNNIYNVLGSGIRSTLNYTELLNLPYVEPPLKEQRTIVEFLDRKIDKINRAIEAQKSLISSLEDYRRGLITTVAFKGMSAQVSRSSYSVSWLHSVPTHWKVLAGKRFHRRVKELNHQRSCSNVLSLTLNGVVNNDLSNPIGLVPQDYATYQLFKKGDLVFKLIDLENRSTSRVGLVHEEGIMSSVYIRVVPGPDSLPEFAHYYYYALYLNNIYNVLGSGIRSTLNYTELLNLPYVEPPLKEQRTIVEFLDRKMDKINRAIDGSKQIIEMLSHQKRVLISQVVFGQKLIMMKKE